ncbi:WXG100 family type VII secretion target [Arthrobacter sp. zg-Y769]|uniref:WXG100 family type VII secretion target n=1 Tax=Arthrobacter sp. zg-Y769 TaxID=2894191 RepID=UPI001E570A1C|nr:WXG100 family type VII secretion target [Arthrobacter sp. zg-Y769]MCC9205841.1 WXG100 family type VII secretion target [Arthrobacter sp. zg-Y769]
MAETGTCDRRMYEVRGGAAGLLVQYEDLARAAGRLETTTGRVRQLEERVTELWLEVGAFGGGSVSADRVRARMMEAGHALRTSAAAVDELADGVRESARAYAEAEGRVLTRIPSVAPFLLTPFAPRRRLRAGGSAALREAGTGLVDSASESLMGAALLLLYGAGRGKLRPVEVLALPGAQERVRLDGTAAGLLERSEVLKRENNPGVIEVLPIAASDGDRAFVVTIPGTQGLGIARGSENAFDVMGVLEPSLKDSAYVAAGVREALRLAGAEAGDAVILSGYSQGGDHATHVAGYLAEESGYEVAFLLTAGSPTGATDLPPGIPALHLEHVQDWVPRLDAWQNPDTPDRVTMTLTNPVVTPEGEDAGLGPGHRLDNYREGAAIADASDDASLRASLESLGAAVAAGSVATRHLYRLSREKLPPRQAAVVPRPAPSRGHSPGPREEYRPPVGP